MCWARPDGDEVIGVDARIVLGPLGFGEEPLVGTEHWATDDLAMAELTRLGLAERTWAIAITTGA